MQHVFALHRHYVATMGSIGDYTCAFDERLLCGGCCLAPMPGETDLRHFPGDPGHRVEVTHARRPVRRVIWLSSCDVEKLESTLLGRCDARYLGPVSMKQSASGEVEPGLQAWWRELRAELDTPQPDLGRELGMAPRFLDFGALGEVPIARPLHLLNPTGRTVVFHFASNILTGNTAGRPYAGQFAYRLACTPAVEAARRASDSFAVPPRDRLVVEVLAQPWADQEKIRRFELWATPDGAEKKYVGEIQIVHFP